MGNGNSTEVDSGFSPQISGAWTLGSGHTSIQSITSVTTINLKTTPDYIKVVLGWQPVS